MSDLVLSPADEQKKQQFITVAKWGVIIAACAVALPVVVFGALGMVGIMIAGGIGLVGINAAPVVALKLANMKYRAMDAEALSHIKKVEQQAAENPIETAVAQSQAFKERGKKQLEAITAYSTEVNNFETMTVEFSKKYPEAAPRYAQQLATMKQALSYKNAKYTELQQNIKKMDEQIEFLKANWKMSQALQKANALAGLDSEDPMAQLKADAAINSVVTSINRAFAEMDSSVLQDAANAGRGTPMDRTAIINGTPGMQSIENNPSPTIGLVTMETVSQKKVGA